MGSKKRQRGESESESEEEDRKERKRRKKEAKKKAAGKKKKKNKDSTTVVASSVEPSSKEDAGRTDDSATTAAITVPATPVLFKKRLEMTVSLLPAGLRDVVKSVEDSLRRFLLRYSDGIDGILLAFENVEILGEGGHILNELPHIHYAVACDGLVFVPTVGCSLTGVVTDESTFHSHLSLIVHGYFNASVPSDCLREAGFHFDGATEQWSSPDGASLPVGTKVEFQVAKVYESVGIISLEGSRPSLVSA